jgi:hypothetical protein
MAILEPGGFAGESRKLAGDCRCERKDRSENAFRHDGKEGDT